MRFFDDAGEWACSPARCRTTRGLFADLAAMACRLVGWVLP